MKQPLPRSRSCLMCGIENPIGLKLKFFLEDGRVHTRVTLPDSFSGYEGVAHGGIVASLLDEAMGWCANCHAAGATTTGELTVRYRHATPVGEALHVEAEVIKSRGPLFLTEGRVRLGDGTVCAEGKGKFMKQSRENAPYDLIHEPGDSRIFDDSV